MTQLKQLYTFTNNEITEDQIDPKTGRVKLYKHVCVIGTSEDHARELGKLSNTYLLDCVKNLGPCWN